MHIRQHNILLIILPKPPWFLWIQIWIYLIDVNHSPQASLILMDTDINFHNRWRMAKHILINIFLLELQKFVKCSRVLKSAIIVMTSTSHSLIIQWPKKKKEASVVTISYPFAKQSLYFLATNNVIKKTSKGTRHLLW